MHVIPAPSSRQRGVAVVTALLLTTLAITIVASLFWQQQVQVRSIENQRLQLQKQWILRGALDWSRLILREDARHSRVDHLGEPWAVPLAETRLDQYVDNARAETDVPDATLSGGIVDAQSRFNLRNLAPNGQIDAVQVVAFAKLLTNARLNPQLAQDTAKLMAAAQPVVQPSTGTPAAATGAPGTAGASGTAGGTDSAASTTATTTTTTSTPTSGSEPQPINILNVEDLLAVPGFTPEALASIKDFIVVLPKKTLVNVNTAPAEVLAAIIGTLSPSDAAALVSSRESAYFKDTSDFSQRLQSQGKTLGNTRVTVETNYFLVNGNVRLSRAGMQMQALIERNGGASTKVIWIRQN